MAALQRVWDLVAWWRGRGGRGGASGRNGMARQWLWSRQQRAAAMSALGRERGRAEKGEEGRKRVRERSEGAAWRLPKRPGRSGKQEVAGAASALATEQLRGEGEEDDREEEVGWAGFCSRPHR